MGEGKFYTGSHLSAIQTDFLISAAVNQDSPLQRKGRTSEQRAQGGDRQSGCMLSCGQFSLYQAGDVLPCARFGAYPLRLPLRLHQRLLAAGPLAASSHPDPEVGETQEVLLAAATSHSSKCGPNEYFSGLAIFIPRLTCRINCVAKLSGCRFCSQQNPTLEKLRTLGG